MSYEDTHRAEVVFWKSGQVKILDGSGNPLTSTLVGSDQALDVNVVQAEPTTLQEFSVTSGYRTDTSDFVPTGLGASSGNKHWIKKIVVTNNDDTDLQFELEDTGGDIIPRSYASAFGGRYSEEFPGKGIQQSTANSNITFNWISGSNDYSYIIFYTTEAA